MNQKSIGDFGENIAFNYLFQKHYQIIARNYRKKWGEIDLVGFDPRTQDTVFFEVKTVTSKNKQVLPEEELTAEKIKRLKRVILSFLSQYHLEDKPWRFDFLAIDLADFRKDPKISHYQGVYLEF
ncbi:MAG: putative endonuclease [Patescibacteria group bacterium]|nr:putative endonuclease [Patescibacteria group bacterium]